MNSQQIEHWLSERIGRALGIGADKVDVEAPFVDHGLDSVAALQMLGELEETLQRPIEPTSVFEHPTIISLARHLASS